MKTLLLAIACLLTLASPAQYYYKDIMGTQESAELVNAYRANKVKKVVISSFNARGEKDENFYVEQAYSPATNSLTTTTRSSTGSASVLVSYFNEEGKVTRTVDSSSVVVSWTDYSYNSEGQLVRVSSSSSDSARSTSMNEVHVWEWNGKLPVKMYRIKNGRDTIFVDFKADDAGNVIEEQETHRKQKAFPYFYYYNDKNQLTDIAQYNARVGKVLPSYMFEYSSQGQVIQKITVPSNKSDYLIWRYAYNDNGLKSKEAVYDKEKKLTGRIEYQYF